jgi:hypothetical protein
MAISAADIQELNSLGLSSEQYRVVLAVLVRHVTITDEKREADRLKSKKYRENKERVTLSSRDNHGRDEKRYIYSKEVSKEDSIPLASERPPKKVVGRKGRVAFPEGFLPKDPLSAWDKVQFEKFRLHHLARGSLMANWEAAWGTWQRSPWYNQGKPAETWSSNNVVPIQKGHFVLDDSPERAAWEEWGRRNGQKYPAGMKSGGWLFPSQWPPKDSSNVSSLGEAAGRPL